MFRRAQFSFGLAVVAGLPAFLGVIQEWEAGSEVASGVCFAFSAISFLFGMFEPESPIAAPVRQPKRKAFEFNQMELIRVAP